MQDENKIAKEENSVNTEDGSKIKMKKNLLVFQKMFNSLKDFFSYSFFKKKDDVNNKKSKPEDATTESISLEETQEESKSEERKIKRVSFFDLFKKIERKIDSFFKNKVSSQKQNALEEINLEAREIDIESKEKVDLDNLEKKSEDAEKINTENENNEEEKLTVKQKNKLFALLKGLKNKIKVAFKQKSNQKKESEIKDTDVEQLEEDEAAKDEAKKLVDEILKNKPTKSWQEVLKENIPFLNIEWDEKKIGLIVFCLLLPIVILGVYVGVKHAVDIEKMPAAKRLAISNIDINNSSLIKYSEIGDTKVIRWLLEAGVPINSQRRFDGKTGLMQAATSGHMGLIELYIEKEADLNVQDIYGQTALMKAVEANQLAIVKKLLRVGARFDIKDNANNTAMDIAKNKDLILIMDVITKMERELAPVKNITTSKKNFPKPNTALKEKEEKKEKKNAEQEVVVPKVKVFSVAGGNQIIKGSAGNISLGMDENKIMESYGSAANLTTDVVNGRVVPALAVYLSGSAPSLMADFYSEKNKFTIRINVYDSVFKTSKNVGVGSLAKEVIVAHNIKSLVENEGFLFLYAEDIGAFFELDLDEAKNNINWVVSGDISSVPPNLPIKRIILR